MARAAASAFCAAQAAANHVVQWGNWVVWNVSGKVFAVCEQQGARDAVTVRVSPLAHKVLSDIPGLRQAPYSASRGLKRKRQFGDSGLSDEELRQQIRASHDLNVESLPKAKRIQLGPDE